MHGQQNIKKEHCVYTHICVTYREGVWESCVTWTRRENEQDNVHHYTVSWYFLNIIMESEMDWAYDLHKSMKNDCITQLIPVAVLSKSYVCGRSLAGFRIPTEAWMFVSCECGVSSCRALCDGPIPLTEESYRLYV